MAAVHASPAVLQEQGAITRTRVVSGIDLRVAPGEPDDPKRARAFLLSWWEKDPPPSAGVPKIKQTHWCFFTKRLGEEGRALVEAWDREERGPIWVAMFGPVYAVRFGRDDE